MRPCETLTPRETEIAALVYDGFLYRQIAERLAIKEQVVRNSLFLGIFDKLGVSSRLELTIYIANHGGPNWRSRQRH